MLYSLLPTSRLTSDPSVLGTDKRGFMTSKLQTNGSSSVNHISVKFGTVYGSIKRCYCKDSRGLTLCRGVLIGLHLSNELNFFRPVVQLISEWVLTSDSVLYKSVDSDYGLKEVVGPYTRI